MHKPGRRAYGRGGVSDGADAHSSRAPNPQGLIGGVWHLCRQGEGRRSRAELSTRRHMDAIAAAAGILDIVNVI